MFGLVRRVSSSRLGTAGLLASSVRPAASLSGARGFLSSSRRFQWQAQTSIAPAASSSFLARRQHPAVAAAGRLQPFASMADAINQQAEVVRRLKAEGAPADQVKAAVAKLLELKAQAQAQEAPVDPAAKAEAEAREAARQVDYLWKENFENLMTRKFFYISSFEIYGKVGGLYDFGPPGCAVRENILETWRRHFVMNENMLEISATCLTPENVLQTSGHVEKFTDFMVRDAVTLECHRADKLLESHIEKLLLEAPGEEKEAELRQVANNADAYSQEELAAALKQYQVTAPDTGNQITDPFPFNLMFATQIGPTGRHKGYLRPETAQGIFVNFRRLLEYNRGQMPLSAAQIGLGFRNEISPRSGLLRVREFPMAEIEHFVDPKRKDHPKFKNVANLELNLLSADDQVAGKLDSSKVAMGEAVRSGLIDNETLGYFMARTHLFMERIGVVPEKLRFRQHKSNEMAHYAKDCWDAEIFLHSYGWTEVAGHADRSAYDLRKHSAARNVDLSASVELGPDERIQTPIIRQDHKLLMQAFGERTKILQRFWKEGRMTERQAQAMLAAHKAGQDYELVLRPMQDGEICVHEEEEEELKAGDAGTEAFVITPGMVKDVKWKQVAVRRYIPSVIEPSFGIGRILYSVLEHSFYSRPEDPARQVLRLKPLVAPHKAALFTLIKADADMSATVDRLEQEFHELGLNVVTDTSGTTSIGKKYSRADEIGVPFNVTVERQQVDTVTIRERDTTAQIRVPAEEVVKVIAALVQGLFSWDQAVEKYGLEPPPAKQD